MTRIQMISATLVVLVVAAGCATSGDDGASSQMTAPQGSTVATVVTVPVTTTATSTPTTTAPPTTVTTAQAPTTTTTTAATTTTLAVTTSTMTYTTVAPVTTFPVFDLPPAAVGGLTVEIGGGSGEVIPEWDRNSESDVATYRLWYSDDPGATKTLLATVAHDPADVQLPAYNSPGNRIAYVDLRAQIEGKHCYQVSAVDVGGNEGPRSPEVCFPVTVPSVPGDFEVGLGGGSGEVSIRWTRITDADADHYNLWYSEWPGGTKTLLAAVAHNPAQIASPAWDAGGGTTEYIDYPRILEDNRNCYQISSVDTTGHESARTAERCSTHL